MTGGLPQETEKMLTWGEKEVQGSNCIKKFMVNLFLDVFLLFLKDTWNNKKKEQQIKAFLN